MSKRVMVRWQVIEEYQAVLTVEDTTDVTDDVLSVNEVGMNWSNTVERTVLESSEVEDEEED